VTFDQSLPPPRPPPPRPGVFVAGTDTGVGKTTCALAILRLARRRGLTPTPYKPAETGCDPDPHDAIRLLSASDHRHLAIGDVCPYPFSSPVAPAVAAAAAACELTLPVLLDGAARAATLGDFLLVEPAGGLLSPYSPHLTAADLATALHLPLLLVARNALGTINHTALSIAEIRRRGLALAGLLLVDTAPQDTPDRPHNADLIAALTGVRALATVPHLPGASPDELADALAHRLDVAALFRAFGADA
jgi:dethiobiotin synthetase